MNRTIKDAPVKRFTSNPHHQIPGSNIQKQQELFALAIRQLVSRQPL
jgi:hypothetical protein